MNRPRIVLDTNVLISGSISRHGPNALLMNAVAADKFALFVSSPILAEYEELLSRRSLHLDLERAQFTRDLVAAKALIVNPSHRLSVSPHEPDNRFLECAEAADTDFLVTGNKRHFPARWKRTEIVTARELLDRLESP